MQLSFLCLGYTPQCLHSELYSWAGTQEGDSSLRLTANGARQIMTIKNDNNNGGKEHLACLRLCFRVMYVYICQSFNFHNRPMREVQV